MAFGEYCYLEQTHKATWKRTQRRPTMYKITNRRNKSQRSFTILTGFKLCRNNLTTGNNMQQDIQTDATCNIQQCCVCLHGA